MNRLSHMMFAFSLFVALYSLVYAFSVWISNVGTLTELLWYYIAGGIALTLVATPILYWKAPHKEKDNRTTSNRSAIGALSFITFGVGSLVGTIIYQWMSGITMIGNLSIFIGAMIIMSGALMPDWDIPFLGISRHRNIVFHSAILPMLVVLLTLVNVAVSILETTSLSVGAHIEYYVAALFLLGYASHLYLDIFSSDSSPLEILWHAVNPADNAPTGLKSLGPFKISKKNARNWLVGNATLLVMIAAGLMGLYFYNIYLIAP
ncbi:MAG: hypothetical protein ACTSU3_05700 [Candidatus Thorarchaeota archaeon]